MAEPHIICTVINDLTYDQRMQRICTSLQKAGYAVTLVGSQHGHSAPLDERPYKQVRLPIKAQAGKQFYIQFNRQLYKWLLLQGKEKFAQPPTAICAIDLDTIVPCYYASKKLGWLRMHDAHELFTELTEVKRRPWIAAFWSLIERIYVPKYISGYTVNQFIASEFYQRYGLQYGVVRNMPFPKTESFLVPPEGLPHLPQKFFLYQGAVNEGRGFDQLVLAMKQVPIPLVIVGNGNYMEQLQSLIVKEKLAHHILLLGQVAPALLHQITPLAYAGITIFENTGLNQYQSLANRFFDYVQAGIPQLCVNYPEYQQLNDVHRVAWMVDNLDPETLAIGLNKLLDDNVLYTEMQQEAKKAAAIWNWTQEEQKLLSIWQQLLPIK